MNKSLQQPPTTTRPKLPAAYCARRASDLARDASVKAAIPLVPGLLYRGRFTLFVAPAKMGKTTAVWSTIAGLATGQAVFGYAVPPCRVLVVALEEALGDTKARVVEHGLQKKGNVFVLPDVDAPGLRPFEVLEANVESIRPDVIVIDTLSAYAAGQVSDENNTMAWMTVLPELSKLAHRRDVALLVLHHANRTGTGARGSTVITAVPDNLAYLSQPKGQPDNVRCLSWKGRQSCTGSALIAYDVATKQYTPVTAASSEGLTTPKADGPSVRPPSAADRVLRLIQARTHPNGALYADLRKNAKMKAERVDATLKQLEAAGTVRKHRDGRSSRYAMA